MSPSCAVMLVAAVLAGHRHRENAVSPPAREAELARLRADFHARTERPIPDPPPARGHDGHWRSPMATPLTEVGVVDWQGSPPPNDGVPFTAFVERARHRYWVHLAGGLSTTDVWFGPFDLRP